MDRLGRVCWLVVFQNSSTLSTPHKLSSSGGVQVKNTRPAQLIWRVVETVLLYWQVLWVCWLLVVATVSIRKLVLFIFVRNGFRRNKSFSSLLYLGYFLKWTFPVFGIILEKSHDFSKMMWCVFLIVGLLKLSNWLWKMFSCLHFNNIYFF